MHPFRQRTDTGGAGALKGLLLTTLVAVLMLLCPYASPQLYGAAAQDLTAQANNSVTIRTVTVVLSADPVAPVHTFTIDGANFPPSVHTRVVLGNMILKVEPNSNTGRIVATLSGPLRPGTYPLTITDTGTGNDDPEASIDVTVGTQGPSGATGPQGLQGPQGEFGPQGPQGDKGDKGDKGDIGAQGSQGPQGSAGPQGQQGERGEVGSQGPRGSQGEAGPQGIQGSAGPRGDTGPQGPAGPQGSQGVQGETGSAGPPGIPGPSGVPGPQGVQGPSGPAGPEGLNWKGAWDPAATYAADDAVSHAGSSWVAKQPSTGVAPAEGAAWTILARKGDKGPAGPVQHDATLAGDGLDGSPLGVSVGGITTSQLGDAAVTGAKVAPGQVVRRLNGLTDNVMLAPGTNVTITPSGNTLTISSTAGASAVSHNATLSGDGTSASPLSVATPLQLNGTVLSGSVLSGVNYATGPSSIGVYGSGTVGTWSQGTAWGVYGEADSIGVVGKGRGNGVGLHGEGYTGVYGKTTVSGGVGIFGDGRGLGYAAGFAGNVYVTGVLSKSGGSFKIDHPLDPANKYLSHSFVESPDMMNVYNGNAVTDSAGFAVVTMPDYFEALNRDFRYQLTVIGQFAQAIVADEINGNRFRIRTDKPGVKVSWQVTGVRHDAWANAHRIRVVEEKPKAERGRYLNPEVHGQPAEKQILPARNPTQADPDKERR